MTEKLRRMRRRCFFEPLMKERTVVVKFHQLPNIGDIVRILGENQRIDYEYKVNSIVHLCTSKDNHLVALHCVRTI